ncbi:MAG: TonB-dependent receptor plug domain-containing protein [Bacteroidetes bacterium]|nr:TonB-dependent receptor [Bacteroidota bacterium]MBV6462196.1 hypothetical protein [Flavobacteriales bacterium]WKZ74780.1 MAG: carboxypeptidase regulatory-like domain-containing protein [Vicingaceae bacterium]MCL4816006.1 carboxypeptidase regulatory-like domain-containing protein [Flavobacteriales bacterium]NOG95164.1 TonB-dependent receptor plug domain-containing protein [Bacteroidota bacterium]
MFKRFTIAILTCALIIGSVYAQVGQGTLKGTIKDKETGEGLPFANIVVSLNGNQVAGAQTDFDGKYTVTSIPPGTYDVLISYVGYQQQKQTGVVIMSGKIQFLDVKLLQGIALEAFEVIEYEVPLISKDQTQSGGTVTREDIDKMAGRDATSFAATVGGVYTKDDGGSSVSIRGAREDGTDVYIDGMKVRGSQNLPKAAIEQVSVITGGLPAQYGDATGGIISITTRGASKEFFGGLEYTGSGFRLKDNVYGLDKFGFNLLGFNVSGPLLIKKDSAGNKQDALFGFFLSGELMSELDDRPSAMGGWRIKDSSLLAIEETPLRPSGYTSGTFPNAEFTRINDFERVKYRQNVARRGINLAAKLDVTLNKSMNLTFGGSYDYKKRNVFVYDYSLFNYKNNPERHDNTWRVFGRFTQRFSNPSQDTEESASLIKNAYFSVQVDYTKQTQRTFDGRHKDNLAHYGYVGKFTSEYINNYGIGFIDNQPAFVHDNFRQVAYNFEYDSTINPVLSNYTKRYYELYDEVEGNYDNAVNVRQGGGLLNGDLPRNIYDMWRAPGFLWNQNSVFDNSQFRISAIGSAEIKDHSFTFGFEFEQRDDRFYSVSPVGLWERGRNLVNNHITQLDLSNPTISYDFGIPTYTYNRLYDAESQSLFDKNLRESLGLAVDGTDFIDFDSYGPDVWKIDYFSADELLNQGFRSSYVSYSGYDHTGKKISGRPSLDDYFTKKDDNGYFTRLIPSFNPIYSSVYLQDKFAFDDLIFNVGVRVDRFDANQPVLTDSYSMFPTVKAGEVDHDKPSNIGDDFVVYVSDVNDPNADNITGYRDGDIWYNAKGERITDPNIIGNAEGVTPWLVDPEKRNPQTDLTSQSFRDYKPQVNAMPRISFSFPISDEALFFAHYDILIQRPSTGLRFDPSDYQFIKSNTGDVINNPDLKPEKTIDYELGFQQKINNFSSLKLSGFYREMRDMIQVKNVIGAYPVSYKTYGNLDFGTVKGTTVSYDLRRVKNISIRASYTLQFADGTGSDATTSLNLVNSGQPNLRTIFPLSFDQRHAFTGVLDYRFAGGKNYNGPVIGGKEIFADAGANFSFRMGSGTPYTKQSNIIPYGLYSQGNTQTVGSLNGSRLPWIYTVDLKVDKNLDLQLGKAKEGEEVKMAALNVYIQVLNLLNTKNVLSVYPTTGNPDDDSYLNDPRYEPFISSQNDEQSFRDLYSLKLQNPGYFSLPRRVRLGVVLNF